MNARETILIDGSLCIGCGRCVTLCPQRTLAIVDGRATVTGTKSLNCGHCQAICPTGAIRVATIDPSMFRFSGFEPPEKPFAFGCGDTDRLVGLMASRRSTRKYTDRKVPEAVLQDLCRIGCLAPSGTNSQLWKFSILPTREHLLTAGRLSLEFFGKLNRIAANPLIRLLSREARACHREYADAVAEGIADFRAGKRDPLFHGAQAAIVIGTKPGASCPCEDALLASQNIMLAAHTMGWGTCLVGMAVEAARRDAGIHAALGFDRGERIHAVIVVGEPDEKWLRFTGRMTADIRTVAAV